MILAGVGSLAIIQTAAWDLIPRWFFNDPRLQRSQDYDAGQLCNQHTWQNAADDQEAGTDRPPGYEVLIVESLQTRRGYSQCTALVLVDTPTDSETDTVKVDAKITVVDRWTISPWTSLRQERELEGSDECTFSQIGTEVMITQGEAREDYLVGDMPVCVEVAAGYIWLRFVRNGYYVWIQLSSESDNELILESVLPSAFLDSALKSTAS